MVVNLGEPRRLMCVSISRELLQQWMTEGWQIGGERFIRCVKGLPDGARNPWPIPPEVIELVFEHETFDLVPEGAAIPKMMCKYSTYIRDTQSRWRGDETTCTI